MRFNYFLRHSTHDGFAVGEIDSNNVQVFSTIDDAFEFLETKALEAGIPISEALSPLSALPLPEEYKTPYNTYVFKYCDRGFAVGSVDGKTVQTYDNIYDAIDCLVQKVEASAPAETPVEKVNDDLQTRPLELPPAESVKDLPPEPEADLSPAEEAVADVQQSPIIPVTGAGLQVNITNI